MQSVGFAAASFEEVAIYGAFETALRHRKQHLGQFGRGRGVVDVEYLKRKKVAGLYLLTTSFEQTVYDDLATKPLVFRKMLVCQSVALQLNYCL